MNNNSNITCLCCSFNSDSSLMAIGTESGYMIYKVHPFTLIQHRTLNGGIAHIEILRKTNILSLIGGGSYPNYPPEYVVFYDDKQSKSISKLKFKYPILKIKLSHIHLFVIFETKIQVINIETLSTIHHIHTVSNRKAVFALSVNRDAYLIAYPSTQIGKVVVKEMENEMNIEAHEFWAHSSEVGCLGMAKDGSLICTASVNGTIIRVFEPRSGKKGFEFRRGSDNAEIMCLEFDWNNMFIVCCSDKETVHVFMMGDKEEVNGRSFDLQCEFTRESIISFHSFVDVDTHTGFLGSVARYLKMPKVYMTGQRNFAFYRDKHNKNTLCSFIPESSNQFILFNRNATVLKQVEFNIEKGGQIKLILNLPNPNTIPSI